MNRNQFAADDQSCATSLPGGAFDTEMQGADEIKKVRTEIGHAWVTAVASWSPAISATRPANLGGYSMTDFPTGTYMLHARIPNIELLRLQNEFLKVDDMEHLGHSWTRYRRAKGPTYRPPGVDTHTTIEFVDPDVPDTTFKLSDEAAVAVAVAENGDSVTFAPGIYVLAGEMPVSALPALGTNVFLPVDEVDYLGYVWRRFRLTKKFALAGGADTLTVEFAGGGQAAISYPAGQSTQVLMAAWPTGKVLGELLGRNP
ncbi:hypothetical protein [Mycobacterium simiae]|uniref:hypothetical protein n=1 Tax=Mycobacterium simiae TaxID=1784 RepID=UPI0012DE0A49|nr:hypothetical protein [Mycobacterium simiae]